MCSSKFHKKSKKIPSFIYYFLAISLGIVNGNYEVLFFRDLGVMIAGMFINMFKFVGLPLIILSLIVTINEYSEEEAKSKIWQKTVTYTLLTTTIASLVSFALYLLIQPVNLETKTNLSIPNFSTTYFEHISGIIPSNAFMPFVEGKVVAILLMGIAIGIATRLIPDGEVKLATKKYFKGIHSIILIITSWIVKIIPIGLFGFITLAIMDLKTDSNIEGLTSYLSVVVSANLIQAFIILPGILLLYKINPVKTFKGMFPALIIAFFSKSSVGTLPVTMQNAEENLGIKQKVSRFVLPLCTSINMNGCAAFIFATSIYVMQNNGIEITLMMMLIWVVISVITAVGNAGVPMGCFFLTTSLLVSMNVPINIMMIILPFYAVIDMIETSLNVWSDSCVTTIIDKQIK